jgi:hypothetical protein
VRRVAEKYLIDGNLTLVTLQPKGKEAAQ